MKNYITSDIETYTLIYYIYIPYNIDKNKAADGHLVYRKTRPHYNNCSIVFSFLFYFSSLFSFYINVERYCRIYYISNYRTINKKIFLNIKNSLNSNIFLINFIFLISQSEKGDSKQKYYNIIV
jgi:hypothetical protein